jgi:hypothetical protein
MERSPRIDASLLTPSLLARPIFCNMIAPTPSFKLPVASGHNPVPSLKVISKSLHNQAFPSAAGSHREDLSLFPSLDPLNLESESNVEDMHIDDMGW